MIALDPHEPSVPAQAIADAIDAHVPLRRGMPIVVRWRHGDEDCVACPDLAHVGDWIVTRWRHGVFCCQSDAGRVVAVAGMRLEGDGAIAVDNAMRLHSLIGDDRHSPDSDHLRLQAGREAMRLVDAMIRARLLDACDGWTAIRDCGTILDDDPQHGTLIRPHGDLQINANVILLRCPSTGRQYAIIVPAEMQTARAAREWMLSGPCPSVET